MSSQPEKRGPGRAKAISSEERRSRILEAAGDLFITEGYSSTNMEQIAKRSGMSKKTLYQMFKGKEDLFEALICDVEEHDSVSAAFLDDAATPEKLLATALLGIVTWVLSPRQIGLTRLVIAESPHIENLGMRFRQNGIEKGRKILCERLKVIHEIHGIRVHDFDETANVLFGAALGNLQLRALTGEDIGLERDERHLTQRIDKIVQMTIAYMKLT